MVMTMVGLPLVMMTLHDNADGDAAAGLWLARWKLERPRWCC